MIAELRPQLKVAIPKDASKPDGDAVENGVFLSASELQARSHFVHSPSDAVPIPADWCTLHSPWLSGRTPVRLRQSGGHPPDSGHLYWTPLDVR